MMLKFITLSTNNLYTVSKASELTPKPHSFPRRNVLWKAFLYTWSTWPLIQGNRLIFCNVSCFVNLLEFCLLRNCEENIIKWILLSNLLFIVQSSPIISYLYKQKREAHNVFILNNSVKTFVQPKRQRLSPVWFVLLRVTTVLITCHKIDIRAWYCTWISSSIASRSSMNSTGQISSKPHYISQNRIMLIGGIPIKCCRNASTYSGVH